MSQPETLLAELVGEELSAVIFVRDYVQLDFDGPKFSLFTWPKLTVGSETRLVGDQGYRDMLCSLIGQPVLTVAENATVGLVLDFSPGSVVIMPEFAEVAGPEIAMLNGFVGHDDWMVWRPGESPFESLTI